MKKPSEPDVIKEDILVKMFSGNLIPVNVLIDDIERRRRIHLKKLSKYREIEQKHFPQPEILTSQDKLKYLVLRAGIRCELEWIDWCDEALETLTVYPNASTNRRSHTKNSLKLSYPRLTHQSSINQVSR